MCSRSLSNNLDGWWQKPRDPITVIEHIVYVNVESTKIIENLSTLINSITIKTEPTHPDDPNGETTSLSLSG